jgi:hypothetical protein
MLETELTAELGPRQAARRVVHHNKVWQFSVEEQLEKLVRRLGTLHNQARVKSAAEMVCTRAASVPQQD